MHTQRPPKIKKIWPMSGRGSLSGVQWPASCALEMRLIALHGFTGTAEDFEAFVPLLPPSWELLALNLPGHGQPASQLEAAPWSMPEAATLVAEVVAGLEDDAEITLLGYSMGARLALHVALVAQGMFERMVLIGAQPGLESLERDHRKQADRRWAERMDDLDQDAFLKDWQAQPIIATQSRMMEPYLSRFHDRRRTPGNMPGWRRAMVELGTGRMPSVWHRLEDIACDVALVAGEDDRKYCSIHAAMTDHASNFRDVVIPSPAGHAPHLEATKRFWQEVFGDTSFLFGN